MPEPLRDVAAAAAATASALNRLPPLPRRGRGRRTAGMAPGLRPVQDGGTRQQQLQEQQLPGHAVRCSTGASGRQEPAASGDLSCCLRRLGGAPSAHARRARRRAHGPAGLRAGGVVFSATSASAMSTGGAARQGRQLRAGCRAAGKGALRRVQAKARRDAGPCREIGLGPDIPSAPRMPPSRPAARRRREDGRGPRQSLP